MNDNYQIDDIMSKAEMIEDMDENVEEINLAGYQVTKAELFSHTKEPAITVWENRMRSRYGAIVSNSTCPACAGFPE